MKPNLQEVGRAAVSTQGRDKGHAYLVVSVIDDRYVLLADGDTRKLTHPKKKQVKHLRVAPLMAADALSEQNRRANTADAAIRKALDDCGGKVSEAAERLKMARVTLWRKMKKLNISR